MKKVLAVASLAALLGVGAVAGPFIGAEIVPHSYGWALPYITVGWDSGSWIKSSFGLQNPGYADGWYMASAAALYPVTPSFRVGGGLNAWARMGGWQFSYMEWSASMEVVGKWKGLLGFFKFHLPLEIASDAPLFGSWISIGIMYDFFPCCVSPVPLCPELGTGGCP